MADKNAEALCGLMDGELAQSEARFLIGRLGHDRDLGARWRRYHLARSAMRGDLGVYLDGFAGRVSNALDSEAAVRLPALSRAAWLKPLGGAALAASVALLAFNAWRQPVAPTESLDLSAPTLAAASEVQPRRAMPLATPASAQLGPERWNPRLRGYLIRHNEVTSPRRGQGLVPYWSLVSEPPPESQVVADEEIDNLQSSADQ